MRVFSQRTADPAYSSGWAYALHYGAREPDPPRTLPDGTIRRYDNAHEDTKGHELHVPDQPTQIIQFPGMRLLTDGRVSQRSLARELDVSVTTVSNHLKALEDEGIIRGYSVNLNYDRIDTR